MENATLSLSDPSQKECELLRLQVSELMLLNQRLQEQIEWFKKKFFGRSSERFVDKDQYYFPGFEILQPPTSKEPPTEDTPDKKKKKKTDPINTIGFPDDLPVEREILDLSEEEKIDPVTGAPLVCIGEEVTRRLGKRPSFYFIREIVRKKYAVAGCPDEGIKTPDLPDSLILRCAVEESIIADVLTKKFCDHTPLYRQVEILERDNISISKQTLSFYVSQASKALFPLYALLGEEIKASGNIFVDETPVKMLAPGTGKTQQCYMLTMVGGQSLDPTFKFYKFIMSRKHEDFESLFEGYQGVFHSDKYSFYEKEAKKEGRVWAPCYAHIRRKYIEAEAGDPKFREDMLISIKRLFEIEERGKSLSPEDRIFLRQKEAEPIIDELIAKNKNRRERGLLPKSKLAIAVGYFLDLEPYLKNYIRHPYARLDNNVAERAVKLIVIGRKNWLFVGSEGGGLASSVIYSLAQTCRALNINPYEYFEDVLRRIQGHPYNRLVELLPHNWKKA